MRQIPRTEITVKRAALLLASGLAIVGLSLTAAAQTDTASEWRSPVNLSRSGAASDPSVVLDADGLVHVLWQDAFDGFGYASGDGVTWESSLAPELPFYTRRYDPELRDEEATPRYIPTLAADADGRIHAFWQDGDGFFYTSSVAAEDMIYFDDWVFPEELAESVAALDVAVGPDGGLHLVYLQNSHSEFSPAGVYAREWDSRRLFWYDPVPLAESVYFRLAKRGEARVALAPDQDGGLIAAWDDARLGVIVQAESDDGGDSWSEPQDAVAEIPGGQMQVANGAGSAQPRLLDLMADAGALHMLWQAGLGDDCAVYDQLSEGGGSWGEPTAVPLDGCGEVQVVQGSGTGHLVHLSREDGDVLLAWDGERWSEPLVLPAGFEDPETGRPVALGCAQVVLGGAGRLVVVGCDEAGGGDIWALTQTAGNSVGELFITPTPMATAAWGTPASVPLLGDEEGQVVALHPAIAGDVAVEGRFHVVWSQPAEDDPDGPGRTLYYARWDALDTERYPRAVALSSSTEEKADQPALAADAAGRLHLVWSGSRVGEIRYSRAVAETAFNPTNWAEPQLLPMVQAGASWPVIAIDRAGVIHVVYVVSWNEGRGVYHTCSADSGESWSEPTTVADGAEAGWGVVDHPTLAVSGDGTLHVAWSALPLPGSLLPSAIYDAYSGDCGGTWSEPYKVAEGAVDWPQLAAVGALEVHLVYAETSGRVPYQHRWSTDGGLTWTRSNWIPGLEGGEGPVGLVADAAGRVHLAAVASTVGLEVGAGSSLQELMWDGAHWIEVGDGTVMLEGLTADGLAVAAGTGSRLGLAMAASTQLENAEGEPTTARMVALLSRHVTLPEVLPTPLPTLTPTATPLPQPTPTQTPEPTPTPDLSGAAEAQLEVGPVSLPSDWAGLIVGAVPAAVVVLLAFAAAALAVRARRR